MGKFSNCLFYRLTNFFASNKCGRLVTLFQYASIAFYISFVFVGLSCGVTSWVTLRGSVSRAAAVFHRSEKRLISYVMSIIYQPIAMGAGRCDVALISLVTVPTAAARGPN